MKKILTYLPFILVAHVAIAQQINPYTGSSYNIGNTDVVCAQNAARGPQEMTSFVTCAPNTFYALTAANEVVSLTINGTSITNNGTIVPAGNGINSLAVANDLTGGSSQKIFYSCTLDSITYYDGANWMPILYDPVTTHNAGGSGSYLYYQRGTFPCQVKRFDGTSLNIIFVDSNATFTVADIGVTPAGNIYYFTGTSPVTQFMHELSPTGVTLNTYPITLNTASAYGCFVMNNIIYIGIGPVGANPNTLIPITITGSVATAGPALSMPAINFKDLAACYGEASGIFTQPAFESNIILYPNPASDILHFEMAGAPTGKLKLTDVQGRIIMEQLLEAERPSININNLPCGIYVAEVTINEKKIFKRVVKQ